MSEYRLRRFFFNQRVIEHILCNLYFTVIEYITVIIVLEEFLKIVEQGFVYIFLISQVTNFSR